MVGQQNGSAYATVLLDLNTQHDFLGEDASCPVRNRQATVAAIRRVIAWAKWNRLPIISALDSHRTSEKNHDGLPRHCIDGTPGQRKLPCTLLDRCIRIEGDNTLALPIDLFERHQQVIFRKRTHDLFKNPKADRFLTYLRAREYVIFGVGLEYSIKELALGLLARMHDVTVVADGCGFWTDSEANLALRVVQTKGARVLTVDELVKRKVKRRMRYPLDEPAHTNVWGASNNGQQGTNDDSKPLNGSARTGWGGNEANA